MTPIIVGLDPSGHSAEALRWAIDEGGRRNLPVRVIYAWTASSWLRPSRAAAVVHGSGPREESQRQPQTYAEELVAKVVAEHAGPAISLSVRALEGRPAALLLEAATGADQVVVGSRGAGGFSRLLLGSVPDQLVRHCPVPVTVVRSGGDPDLSGRPRVVVGVDGSPASRVALHRAAEAAHLRGATLDIVAAFEPGAVSYVGSTVHLSSSGEAQVDAAQALALVVDDVLDDDLVPTHRRVEEGDPAAVLLRAADNADLLVLGSRGRDGFAGLLLGGVSAKCLHHASCTVQTVPPDGGR